jgi:hypothetical protein
MWLSLSTISDDNSEHRRFRRLPAGALRWSTGYAVRARWVASGSKAAAPMVRAWPVSFESKA